MAGSVELSTQAFAAALDSVATSKSVDAPVPAARPKVESVRSLKAESNVNEEVNQRGYQKFGDSTDQIREAISSVSEALNAVAKATDRNLAFSVNDETGDIVIQVTDADTGEEIRTIPTEHVLQMKRSITNMAGLLFDSAS